MITSHNIIYLYCLPVALGGYLISTTRSSDNQYLPRFSEHQSLRNLVISITGMSNTIDISQATDHKTFFSQI